MTASSTTARQPAVPIMQVDDLAFAYDKNQPVFQHVSFALQRGEILQILGANGSGKSTLMNCLVHQVRPDAGRIWLAGRDADTIDRKERARLLAYVPQLANGGCAFRVLDYLVMGRSPYLRALRAPREADYAIARQIIRELCLTALQDKRLDQLSGGERQQVQIARALVQESDILLLDEPTNHLDYGVQHRIWELLVYLAQQGKTVIATTHLPDSPLITGGKAGIFVDGAFLFGDAAELITGAVLNRIYHIQAKTIWIEDIQRKACFCLRGQNRFAPLP